MSIILNAVGDFILNAFGQTSNDPFEFVYDELKDCDLLFGNNETVITDYDTPFFKKRYSIRTPSDSSKYLAKAEFDLLQFANNHCFDFGVQGVKDSLKEFNKLNIPTLGVGLTEAEASRPIIIERDGIKIGFYGMGDGQNKIEQDGVTVYFNSLNHAKMFEHLAELRKKVDVLIVSVHWDNECIDYPTPEVQQLARKIIDAGVDLILGHHPHIPHGIEKYNNGLIVYSLGNFQFKCTVRPELDYSFIFKVELDKNGVVDYQIIPVMVGADSRPHIAVGQDAETILDFIKKVSEPLTAGITTELFETAACEVFFKDHLNSWAQRIEQNGEAQLLEMFKWFSDPVKCHRFYLLMQKKNWTIYDLIKALDIELKTTIDDIGK
jgi:poly-gamma-glutamate capsule biosynthesis protein CapA/YwtB (metallophosphatase superfamily)